MVAAASRASSFEQTGFLTGIRVMDEAEAGPTRRQFDTLEAAEGRERCQIGLLDRHLDQLFAWELATHPAVLDSIEAVMGPDILLLATHFFCKYPEPAAPPETGHAGKFVAWHQDVTYWGLEPPYAVTAWYAVDDSDAENGCMRAIPGTHAAGIREHGKSGRSGNLLSINREVPVTGVDEVRTMDMPPRA